MVGKSSLDELSESLFAEKVEEMVQTSPNPELAKTILFTTACDPFTSNATLRDYLGIPQEEIDNMITFLGGRHLLKLSERIPFATMPELKWDVRINDKVREYLESELAYGPHVLIEETTLSDKRLLRAMSAVSDLLTFRYQKRVNFPLDELREIRDESHRLLDILAKNDEGQIREKFGISPNWETGLPYFAGKRDGTKIDGYDKSRFELSGQFPSPEDAFAEGFDEAKSEVPFPAGRRIGRIDLIHIHGREGSANTLILHNPRYGAAAHRSMEYQERLAELLPLVQGKLEESLQSTSRQ